MSSTDLNALLGKYLNSAQKKTRWLERSHAMCQTIQVDSQLSEEAFDRLENLTSRFARLSDVLLQKNFCLIDQAMLENSGSLIDIINRAEKRGLCDAQIMRNIRELRNAIAHEYTEDELLMLFKAVQQKVLDLLKIFKKTALFIKDHKLLFEEAP